MVKKRVMVSALMSRILNFEIFTPFFLSLKYTFFLTTFVVTSCIFVVICGLIEYTFFFETIIISNLVNFSEVVTIVSYQNPKKKVYFFPLRIVNIKLFYYLFLFLSYHQLNYGLKFNIYDILFRKKKYIFQKKSIFGRNMVYFLHFPSFSRIRK